MVQFLWEVESRTSAKEAEYILLCALDYCEMTTAFTLIPNLRCDTDFHTPVENGVQYGVRTEPPAESFQQRAEMSAIRVVSAVCRIGPKGDPPTENSSSSKSSSPQRTWSNV